MAEMFRRKLVTTKLTPFSKPPMADILLPVGQVLTMEMFQEIMALEIAGL